MPGSTPATSQLDWLSSTTAMIVLSWSKATRDLLKSFSWGITALRQLFASDDGAISSSPAPYHLSVPLQSRQPPRAASTTLGSIAERTGFPQPIVPKPLRPPLSPARRRAPARAGRCLDPDQDDWLTENG